MLKGGNNFQLNIALSSKSYNFIQREGRFGLHA
jgi:hypothetical protein